MSATASLSIHRQGACRVLAFLPARLDAPPDRIGQGNPQHVVFALQGNTKTPLTQASVLLVLQELSASKVVHHRKVAEFVFKERILQLVVEPTLPAALARQTATALGHLIQSLQHLFGQAHLWFFIQLLPILVYLQCLSILSRFHFPAVISSILEV